MVTGIILLLVALSRGELKQAVLSFAVGALGGFLLDCIGVAKLKFWFYPRQPFLSIPYFAIVVPAWGVFGMTINLIWNWMFTSKILVFLALTLGLFLLYEIPNLKTGSWRYFVSMKTVVPGWFPLILGIRIAFLLLCPII